MADLDKAIQIAESFVNGFYHDDKDHVGRIMELGQGKIILESLQFAKSQQAEIERLQTRIDSFYTCKTCGFYNGCDSVNWIGCSDYVPKKGDGDG